MHLINPIPHAGVAIHTLSQFTFTADPGLASPTSPKAIICQISDSTTMYRLWTYQQEIEDISVNMDFTPIRQDPSLPTIPRSEKANNIDLWLNDVVFTLQHATPPPEIN